MLVKQYKLSVRRWTNSGDLRYCMVTLVNIIALYTRKLLWEQSFNILMLTTTTATKVIMWDEECFNLIVVNISQYICVSNNHILHFKPTQCYINYISIKLEKSGKKKKNPPPVQGTRVQSLVWEDPTCLGAAKPMHHNYWTCALEPVLHNKRSHCNEKPVHCNEDPM